MLWVCSTLTFKAGSPGGHYSLFFFFSSVKSTANNSSGGTKESKLSLCKYKNTYANYLYLAWKRASLINSSVQLY